MTKNPWTAADIEIVRLRYATEATESIAVALGRTQRSVYECAAQLGIKKSPEYYASGNGSRLDGVIGKSTRFAKGIIPWNKGKAFRAGGRSAETQFKPGEMPHTWRPIGTERLSKDGYLQRKMTDTGVTRHDYVFVHRLIWIESGREIPKGHALVFKDGNRKNIVLDNLELITRAELMRRNTIHNYPKAIAELVQLRGAISRQINRREEACPI